MTQNILNIRGYHSCKITGGKEHIFNNAPFLSELNERQWLTQGYYFWTDSIKFAHKWGELSVKGDYAVLKCLVKIERDLLLDLVGSVEDQLYFDKILHLFYQKLKEADPEAKPPTVNAVLSFYRKEAEENQDIFPYCAIKAQDAYSESKVLFTERGRGEELPLVTRQQLCLFEFASYCIHNKEVVHPQQF